MPTTNSDLFEMMGVAHLHKLSLSYFTIFRSVFRARSAVEPENFAEARHHLNVLKRSVKQRPRLTQSPGPSAQSCENVDSSVGFTCRKDCRERRALLQS
jgi:hypothetical protein